VAGDLVPFERFFAHAGAAHRRERTRTNDRSRAGRSVRRAEAFERCAEILDGLAMQEDPELMALRIAVRRACSCRGFGEISFWTIRAKDRTPVKIAAAVRPEAISISHARFPSKIGSKAFPLGRRSWDSRHRESQHPPHAQ
jgi:hypothetical protein